MSVIGPFVLALGPPEIHWDGMEVEPSWMGDILNEDVELGTRKVADEFNYIFL